METGCSRQTGFSTQNDLARHQRSVHKITTSAPGKQYNCTIDGCKEKYKIWPRADNFRSHLRSVHGIPSEVTLNRAYLDKFVHQHTQGGSQGAPSTATSRPACENGLDLLQGVGAGSIGSELDPRGFPNTQANWGIEAHPPLPPGSSAVSGGDQAMADFDDLRLETVGGAMEPPASQQLLRHPDIPRQVQETLSHLPHSRPVSALGRADGREAKPFQPPAQGPRRTLGPTEATSTIEPQLTYWVPAQQDETNRGLVSQTNKNADAGSAGYEASSSALPLHRQPEEPADVKRISSHSTSLDSSAMSSVNTDEQPETVTPQEIDFQKEDEIMKTLEGIPTDILSRYLREKGIYPNTDSGRDSGDSGTEQKHLCTWPRCERKFNRKSELK